MKDAPSYPWQTRVELALAKADETADRIVSKPLTDESRLDYRKMLRAKMDLTHIQQTFEEVAEVAAKYK